MPTGAALALSFAGPLAVTLVLTPLVRRRAVRRGYVARPVPSRFHEEPTPYLGGVAVGAGVVTVGVVVAAQSAQMAVAVVAAVAVGTIGLIDDRRSVGPVVKLIVEAAGAVALWEVGVRVEVFQIAPVDLGLTVLWVLAVTNAFNLIDNKDGLAAGLAALSAATFAVLAVHEGDGLDAALGLAVAGACLGFLRFNFPPARIFLGDAGSLFLGFVLAALAIRTHLLGAEGIRMALVPLLVLAVPLVDTTFVIVSRLRSGRPVHIGGTDHTSHLLSRSMSARGVALTMYGLQAVLALAAIWLNATGSWVAFTAAVSVVVAIVVSLWLLSRRRAEPVPAGTGSSEPGGRDQAEPEGLRERLGPGVGAELRQDPLHVRFQGVRGDG